MYTDTRSLVRDDDLTSAADSAIGCVTAVLATDVLFSATQHTASGVVVVDLDTRAARATGAACIGGRSVAHAPRAPATSMARRIVDHDECVRDIVAKAGGFGDVGALCRVPREPRDIFCVMNRERTSI